MPELTDTHMELTVLGTMDMLDTHTATDTPDTHTVMPDTHTLTDTESRLVKLLENHYIKSSYQYSSTQNLWNLKMSTFQKNLLSNCIKL